MFRMHFRGAFGPKVDNINVVGPERYTWHESRFPTLVWESVSFDLIGSVCSFGTTIMWDTTRTLCLHERCLSHLRLEMGESFWHYIDIGSSQHNRVF